MILVVLGIMGLVLGALGLLYKLLEEILND